MTSNTDRVATSTVQAAPDKRRHGPAGWRCTPARSAHYRPRHARRRTSRAGVPTTPWRWSWRTRPPWPSELCADHSPGRQPTEAPPGRIHAGCGQPGRGCGEPRLPRARPAFSQARGGATGPRTGLHPPTGSAHLLSGRLPQPGSGKQVRPRHCQPRYHHRRRTSRSAACAPFGTHRTRRVTCRRRRAGQGQ